MTNRKKIIQEIINNFQIMKNKMHAKFLSELKRNITISQWFALDIIERKPDEGIKEISNIFPPSWRIFRKYELHTHHYMRFLMLDSY